ncbi:MAG TPA: tRNA (N(6)-L-threonylcarbamoyladenosine(37)-C(2))-methylthiotransferase, partial [Fibrobacteraceae bacterium]|nr:tRNA (N(6)-L-threonylcarbamoyladenosine(37)-C(2))-methylthiotransferase [Fibrobacteraceae bacterium]
SLKHIQEFPEVISLVFSEKQKIQMVSNSKFLFQKSPDLSKRENQSVGIVNISQGCLNACAFCSTHLVKGIHRSIPVEQIIEEVRFLVSDGAKEILLTGQDTSCYGFDFGTNLAALVRQILEKVPGHYYLRLGMGNPRHLKNYLDELLEVYQDDRIYKFIHLPIQSGSDSVLKKMRRQNSVADYLNLVEKFKNKFSKLTLSTDIIVGFPGETDDDFNSTVKLIEETRPSLCNITRFVARPGTPAFEMSPKVLKSIQSERSAALSAIFQKIALENNQEWIDWEGEVLIEKEGFRKGTSIGRNFAYRPVALKGSFPIGSFYDVNVKAAETFALIAEII